MLEVDKNKNRIWKNEKGNFHREDGPAVEKVNGYKEWRMYGKRHRTDGPAVEMSNGSKQWWINGKLHRTDGPACEGVDGRRNWWIDGVLCLTEYEYKKKLLEWQNINKQNI